MDLCLTTATEQPDNSRQAVLYWDEGLYVTEGEDSLPLDHDGCIVTYPSLDQPVKPCDGM